MLTKLKHVALYIPVLHGTQHMLVVSLLTSMLGTLTSSLYKYLSNFIFIASLRRLPRYFLFLKFPFPCDILELRSTVCPFVSCGHLKGHGLS